MLLLNDIQDTPPRQATVPCLAAALTALKAVQMNLNLIILSVLFQPRIMEVGSPTHQAGGGGGGKRRA